MSLPPFDESRFKAQVANTLGKIRNILDITRAPQLPSDVQHQYDDKYGLAEFLANTAIAAGHECLAQLGLDAAGMQKLVGWARERNVTLRFVTDEKCVYLREETRKVESSSIVTKSSFFGKSSTKVVTKITEHFWQFDCSWSVSAFVGTGSAAGEQLPLVKRAGRCEVKTMSKTSPPRVEARQTAPIDVSIAWLLRHAAPAAAPASDSSSSSSSAAAAGPAPPAFAIDRSSAATCRTPRRNPEIDGAFDFFRGWFQWAASVHAYLLHDIIPLQADHGLDVYSLNDEAVLMPVAALFEEGRKGPPTAPKPLASAVPAIEEEKKEGDSSSAVVPAPVGSALLPIGDASKFLAEQRRTLAEKNAAIAKTFPSSSAGKLASVVEAQVIMLCTHMQRLAQAFADGVDSIELMLRRQLIAAVGRELTAFDFAQYMRYHNRKLYRAAFEPRPFSYAIRRPDHYPEGVLSIESTSPGDGVAGQTPEPILTHVRKVPREASTPMQFALDAATNVTFGGERFLHGWVRHHFSGQSEPVLTLCARARQFSSFLVLVGTVASGTLFLPKHALILQNKDDLSIPLDLETLPSAKEFAEKIQSMSPEQQRFAQAIRSMQLEGSLFGICVIQLKPQLERLLGLADDSLTKEIRLTQDLLELFIKYQIPSDLLSFHGPEAEGSGPGSSSGRNFTAEQKLSKVKAHVVAIQSMIQAAKDKEIADRAAEALAARLAAQAAEAEAQARYDRECRKSLACAGLDGGASEDDEDECDMGLMKSMSLDRSEREGGGGSDRKQKKGKKESMVFSKKRSSSAKAESMAPAMDMECDMMMSSDAPAPVMEEEAAGAPAPAPAETATNEVNKDGGDESKEAHEDVAEEAEPAAEEAEAEEVEVFDWTTLPVLLDKKLMELDPEAALRPTILSAGSAWTRRGQKNILAPPETVTLNTEAQTLAKQEAFDLLDALSRSGSLQIDCAELHIVIAATHCFDQSLIDTVIQANVNPIEKVERSSLLLATTIQNEEASLLIKPDQKDRVKLYNQQLFLNEPKSSAVARA